MSEIDIYDYIELCHFLKLLLVSLCGVYSPLSLRFELKTLISNVRLIDTEEIFNYD